MLMFSDFNQKQMFIISGVPDPIKLRSKDLIYNPVLEKVSGSIFVSLLLPHNTGQDILRDTFAKGTNEADTFLDDHFPRSTCDICSIQKPPINVGENQCVADVAEKSFVIEEMQTLAKVTGGADKSARKLNLCIRVILLTKIALNFLEIRACASNGS